MTVITLTAQQFAELVQRQEVIMLPVAIAGFVYGVVKGTPDTNIYRVAIA